MMQLGKYAFGYEQDQSGFVYKDRVAIFKDGKAILRLSYTDAKEVAKLMASWYKIGSRSELADSELFEELRERGYSGTLKLEKEVDI